LMGCLHPRCQSESLPPPSPPIPYPYCPHERASGRGCGRSTLDRKAGDERPWPAPWQAAFIRAAKLHPYRRHRRQAASLPPPHERARGQAGGATGDPRSTGVQATSDPGRPLAGCLYPRCQAESLPPTSRAGARAGGRGQRPIPLDRKAGDERPQSALWQAASIHAAKPNPYPRHHRQSRIPAAPLTSGPAGKRAGPPAIPLDQKSS